MLKKYVEKLRIKVVVVELYERLVLVEKETVEYLKELLGGNDILR